MPDVSEPNRMHSGAGETPLVRSHRIGPSCGLPNLWFKLENLNPTGSYKDRFAVMAISRMRESGKSVCLATSSGNAGAALAAACAAAQIPCQIAVVETAPAAKMVQMAAHGARLVRIKEFGLSRSVTARVFQQLQDHTRGTRAALEISAFQFSPESMSGVKTLAYEIVEELEGELHHVFCPVGGGGLALALAKGFRDWFDEAGGNLPILHCVQPEGNDTLVGSLRDEGKTLAAIEKSTTRISGLQIPDLIDVPELSAMRRHHPMEGHLVTDEEIYFAQKRLANEEGIFAEPAGATSLAGLLRSLPSQSIRSDHHLVCVITGAGFKDLAGWKTADVPVAMIDRYLADLASLELSRFSPWSKL